MGKQLTGIFALILLVVLFFGVNIVSTNTLRHARIDLTQDKLYTLSPGARNVARQIDEPITLTLFYSAKLAADKPAIRAVGQRVREMLEQFAGESGGKIKLKVIDPEPFSDDEDRAKAAGLTGRQATTDGKMLYLGLSGTNAVDGREKISFLDNFSPQGERFLEYEIAKMIYTLSHPQKKPVGLLASIGQESFAFDPRTQQPKQTPAWEVFNELKQYFDVKPIQPTVTEIPADINVLVVVHPKNLPEAALYAIDQFVMRGGKLLAYVDPRCEFDPSGNDPRNPMAGMMADKSSSLNTLLEAWGVEVPKDKVLADRGRARLMNAARDRSQPISVLHWPALDESDMVKDDAVTGQFSAISLSSSGVIRKKTTKPGPDGKDVAIEGPLAEIVPMVYSSDDAMLIDAQRVAMGLTDQAQLAKDLLQTFKASGEKYVVVARLKGNVKSAFPGGKPKPASPQADQPQPTPDASLKESKGSINVILAADVDMLYDVNWLQQQQLFGQNIGATPIADNGNLFMGAVDNLSGSSDLISLRARGKFSRPFDRVEKLRKDAEARSMSELDALKAKQQDAAQKLQDARAKAKAAGLKADKEQEALLLKFEEDERDAARALRKVQLSLNRDIDALGSKVKFLNIGLVPACVTLLAVGLGAYRASRRQSTRTNMAQAG